MVCRLPESLGHLPCDPPCILPQCISLSCGQKQQTKQQACFISQQQISVTTTTADPSRSTAEVVLEFICEALFERIKNKLHQVCDRVPSLFVASLFAVSLFWLKDTASLFWPKDAHQRCQRFNANTFKKIQLHLVRRQRCHRFKDQRCHWSKDLHLVRPHHYKDPSQFLCYNSREPLNIKTSIEATLFL